MSTSANVTQASSAAAIPASGEWTDRSVVDSVTLFDSNATSHGGLTYQVINKTGTDSFLMQTGGYLPSSDSVALVQRAYDYDQHAGTKQTWEAAHNTMMYTQLHVSGLNNESEGMHDTLVELNPLDSTGFKVTQSIPYSGSQAIGYDNTRGVYVVEEYLPDLDYFRQAKNVYPSLKMELTNDNLKRKIRLNTQDAPISGSKYDIGVTGTNMILTDENMSLLGIPVQINTKWDDESGNINWTSKNESYSSFDLEASAEKTMWARFAMQNWGSKAQVGNNNLDLKDYVSRGDLWYEMFVGNAEVYCFGPDSPGSTIYDVRSLDPSIDRTGTGLPSASGVEFLTIHDGSKWVDAKRKGPGLRFDSYGPNLAQMTLVEQSPAGGADFKGTSTTSLVPSEYGTRVFHKLRYDFLSDLTLTDPKHQLRLLTLNNDVTASSRMNKVSYLNAAGQQVDVNLAHTGATDVDAAPLNAAHPWVATYGNDDANTSNVGYIVQSVDGALDGQTLGMSKLAVSQVSTNAKNPTYLVPNLTSASVKAGDHIDLVVEVFNYKTGNGADPVALEATKWPTNVTMTTWH